MASSENPPSSVMATEASQAACPWPPSLAFSSQARPSAAFLGTNCGMPPPYCSAPKANWANASPASALLRTARRRQRSGAV